MNYSDKTKEWHNEAMMGVHGLAQHIANHHAALNQMLGDHMARIHAMVAAPKRVVRDPQTQRIIGVETVTK